MLVPLLDGYATYRYTDPTQLPGCADGFPRSCSPGDCGCDPMNCGGMNPGGMGGGGNCCDNQGRCGPRCPGTGTGPGPQTCMVDPATSTGPGAPASPCPPPPPPPTFDTVTMCTQGESRGRYHCTPRDCAAACDSARGCVSFRYNFQQQQMADGQPVQCGQSPHGPSHSYCDFSHTCTADDLQPGANLDMHSPQWHWCKSHPKPFCRCAPRHTGSSSFGTMMRLTSALS